MDLGLERAGMQCAWQVEIDTHCRQVLRKIWPDVPKLNDVRECGKYNLEDVDLIAGGFPCQDLSGAQTGKRDGLDGRRSGLWSEFARILCELRPALALIENSPMLVGNGLDRVLCDLAALRYDAEWSTLSACAMGATHPRERLFVLAYPAGDGRFRRGIGERGGSEAKGDSSTVGTPHSGEIERLLEAKDWLAYQPESRRATNGVSSKVDRLRGLGNALCAPQAQAFIESYLEIIK